MLKKLSEENIKDIDAILTAATILDETIAKHSPLMTKYATKAHEPACDAIMAIIRNQVQKPDDGD